MNIAPVLYSRKEMFHDDHAATMVNEVPVNDDLPIHGHDFFEIAIAAEGIGSHTSVNGEMILTKGDVVLLRPGAWHGYTRCRDLLICNCCFDPALLQRELGWLREDAALNYLLWTGPYTENRRGLLMVRLRADAVVECLDRLNKLREVQDSPHRPETLGRLLIFLDSLARGVEELGVFNHQARSLHPAVLETMRLLEGQASYDWSLRELAERAHLNTSYLVRLFKAEVGLSPIAYLNRWRVERAAGLLLHTLMPISEVAEQVGWFDPNLFARRFRAAYQLSPSEYRKRFGSKAQRA